MQFSSPARLSHGASLSTTQERHIRSYEIAALRPDGTLGVTQVKAPSFPMLDAAFSAFAHGALLSSPDGHIAIEDLQPGDLLNTTSGDAAEVVWIGSTTFAPSYAGQRTSLVRIMADTFGPGRPGSFVTVGPGARILQTPPALRSISGGADLLTPAQSFVDNVNVIEVTPPTPVRLFHICLTRHAAIDAGGIAMETYHPGATSLRNVTHAERDFFLSLFPRVGHAADFGPLAHPRAPEAHGAAA